MKDKLLQAFKFFGISGIGWIIDILIYSSLSNLIFPWLANMISSFISITFVFIVSTRRLFVSNSQYNLKIKYFIYILYQVILIFCSSFLIKLLIDWLGNINFEFIHNFINIIAKILVTPFTMILNFLVMKCLIEKI